MPILRKTEIFEEFVMEKKIIYLKAEQSSYVNHEKIHIGDIASVFCEDKEIEKKIKNIFQILCCQLIVFDCFTPYPINIT